MLLMMMFMVLMTLHFEEYPSSQTGLASLFPIELLATFLMQSDQFQMQSDQFELQLDRSMQFKTKYQISSKNQAK